MNIAFFDFDGTITRKDSLAGFIQFAIGKRAYYLGLLKLSPMLLAYKLKIIANDIAKEKLIAHFFQGYDYKRFQEIAEQYSLHEIDLILRPKAIAKIEWHQGRGDQVVIVSASPENWLSAWCAQKGIDLLATRLEIKNDQLTGRFATKNCFGIEKTNRIKERYDLARYETIYAYGDSRGDREMLQMADQAHFKPFAP